MGEEITCAYIIAHFLKNNGYDGLYSGDCSCDLDDLIPCGCDWAINCKPGYKIFGCNESCGEGCDFHIVPKKD